MWPAADFEGHVKDLPSAGSPGRCGSVSDSAWQDQAHADARRRPKDGEPDGRGLANGPAASRLAPFRAHFHHEPPVGTVGRSAFAEPMKGVRRYLGKAPARVRAGLGHALLDDVWSACASDLLEK